MISADHIWMLALAIILDAAIGDPALLWRRIPHPVVALGALISATERALNRPALPAFLRRVLGVVAILVVVGIAGAVGMALESGLSLLPYGWIGIVLLAAILLAARSLFDHVRAVAVAFAAGLPAARSAVAQIVGRDPGSLDEPHICRAAIESTAENLSDGVIAPALWFLVAGLPGLFAYKAINTADSMIGHRTERHVDFGWAAARLDDLVNLVPARVSGALVAIAAPVAGGSIAGAFGAMARDAGKHRSPNAGWPEAAMAAALGVALAGPRRYGGRLVDDPFVNPHGSKTPGPADIRRGLRVYVGAISVFLALLGALSPFAAGLL